METRTDTDWAAWEKEKKLKEEDEEVVEEAVRVFSSVRPCAAVRGSVSVQAQLCSVAAGTAWIRL